jgi:hypothetical protein
MVDTNLARALAVRSASTAGYKGKVRIWFMPHWLPSLGFRVLSARARLVACASAPLIRSRGQERVRTRAEERQTVAVERITKSQRDLQKE